MYESAGPPMGDSGVTNCSRARQVFLIMLTTRSTWSSLTPINRVVFPSRRNPPVLANLVAEKQIVVTSADGNPKRHSRYMVDTDIVEKNPQTRLF